MQLLLRSLPVYATFIKILNVHTHQCLSYNIIHWGNTNECHLKILKLRDLYKYYAAIETFEGLMKGNYRRQHGANTRNADLAIPKFQRLSRTQQSISFSGPTIYNALPPYIRTISSLNRFKIDRKTYLLSHYRQ